VLICSVNDIANAPISLSFTDLQVKFQMQIKTCVSAIRYAVSNQNCL